jgi:hypothetical protein
VITFVATFLTTLGGAILTIQSAEFSGAFIVALIIAAARAALKEVFARFAPVSFGGRVGPTLFGRRHA